MSPPVVWHLGALHGVEVVLVLVLAFGPLLAAGAVVHAIRRHEDRGTHDGEEASVPPGQAFEATTK